MILHHNYLKFILIAFSILIGSCRSGLNFDQKYSIENLKEPEAPLVAEVLMHLQLDYAEPEKLDPKILLKGALNELEKMVPEIWVLPQYSDAQKVIGLSVEVGKQKLILPILELDELKDLKNVLQELIKHLLKINLDLSQLEIEHFFVRGILDRLDGYSVLLPNEIFRDFNINIDGQFPGVGLVVGMRDGFLTVISPMDGSPAARAGLKPLDRIVAVDEEETEHLTLEEILHRLRGNLGTSVSLKVLRKGITHALNFVLVREEIKVESIEKIDFISNDETFRYIRIKNFQIGTSKELKNKIKNFKGIHGLILDLRNNPGGLLEEAVKVSDIFLSSGKSIVSMKGPSVSSLHKAKKLFFGEFFEKVPLVVLINRGSASASEIVAASLKQNNRAIIVGEKSFGKGTVQTLWNLNDGSGLKLTIAEYLTPSGSSIHNVGIVPSLTLIPVSITEDFYNMKTERGSNKKYLDQIRFRLLGRNEMVNNLNDTRSYSVNYLLNNENVSDNIKIINGESFSKKLNFDIFIQSGLKALQIWNTENIYSDLRKNFRNFEISESEKIFKKLSSLGIDWSSNKNSKVILPSNLKFSLESKRKSADILSLKVKIQNNGDITAHRLIAVTKSNNVFLDGIEFPLGKVSPGESQTRQITVKYVSGMMEEKEIVDLILLDQNLKDLKSLRKKINFPQKRNPSFRFNTRIFDDGTFGSIGNGDGKIQSGEIIALSFQVENLGEQIVPELLLKIRGDEGKFRINRGKIILKKLIPDYAQKDFFLLQSLSDSKNLGKISLEMIDKNSVNPRVISEWDLVELLKEHEEVTQVINWLSLNDVEGNIFEGETNLGSLILNGGVGGSSNLKDLYVHLNGKKVYYSSNAELKNPKGSNFKNKKEFLFSTMIQLVYGLNKISVFVRNRNGTVSERKIKILRTE